MDKKLLGHLLAVFTVLVWGETFISTKVLLQAFSPIEILICRFSMGYLALVMLSPKCLSFESFKREGTYALAAFCGIFCYYLFENMALDFTYASNVGIISSSIAPFSTVIIAHLWLGKNERMRTTFFIGFLFSLIGISLISLNGLELKLNPLGDGLTLISASFWGVYSVLMKKISEYGHPVIRVTRRIFFYGIIFMLPVQLFFVSRGGYGALLESKYLLNMVFLGIFASAICFITWNTAVSYIGAVKTGFYIYAMPVITVACSVLVLNETITLMSALGTAFTILGLVISEWKS